MKKDEFPEEYRSMTLGCDYSPGDFNERKIEYGETHYYHDAASGLDLCKERFNECRIATE
jgi:hypothetical protein